MSVLYIYIIREREREMFIFLFFGYYITSEIMNLPTNCHFVITAFFYKLIELVKVDK